MKTIKTVLSLLTFLLVLPSLASAQLLGEWKNLKGSVQSKLI